MDCLNTLELKNTDRLHPMDKKNRLIESTFDQSMNSHVTKKGVYQYS